MNPRQGDIVLVPVPFTDLVAPRHSPMSFTSTRFGRRPSNSP